MKETVIVSFFQLPLGAQVCLLVSVFVPLLHKRISHMSGMDVAFSKSVPTEQMITVGIETGVENRVVFSKSKMFQDKLTFLRPWLCYQ